MALKAEVSIPVALATMTVVYGTYQVALPNLADARTVPAGNAHLASAERTALAASAGVAAAISLIARDSVPFILGGLFAVGLSWMHRAAAHTDPVTGRIARPTLTGRRYTVESAG
jgi:hypothetical protein